MHRIIIYFINYLKSTLNLDLFKFIGYINVMIERCEGCVGDRRENCDQLFGFLAKVTVSGRQNIKAAHHKGDMIEVMALENKIIPTFEIVDKTFDKLGCTLEDAPMLHRVASEVIKLIDDPLPN
jgi:hypothetical protein